MQECCCFPPPYSRKENDAGVGHGVGQAQDAAAHDGVAQVEDRHPKGGVAGMLLGEKESSFVRITQ